MGQTEKYILERKVFHAGQVFLRANEPHSNAYIIQTGEVRSFTEENGEKVEVARFGPEDIIAEGNLLMDKLSPLSYEAVMDTTVVVIVRQDFEKKLSQIDPTLLNIILALIHKLKNMEMEKTEHSLEEKRIDSKAFEIVEHLLRDMSDKERKTRYRDILQPHFNIMCRALHTLKQEERARVAASKKGADEKGDE